MNSSNARIIREVAEKCHRGGECAEACDLLRSLGELRPGEIVQTLLNGIADEKVRDFILKCSLCGLCAEICPYGVEIPTMVRAARAHFIENGMTDPEIYRALWVDHDWNVITLYRHMQQIDKEYIYLLKQKCDVLFFPGCTLANESPDLVRSAVDWLAGQGEDIAVSLQCCGAPLAEMGLKERAERYTDRLWQKIRESGASRVVTSCPACHDKLMKSEMGGGIEVCSLFQLMAESGVKVPVIGSGRITLHDSCFDRKGKIGNYVRALLRDYDIREMKHHRRETLCCGSGGVVSMVDPEICKERSRRRLKEMEETEADVCIAYCMACAQRLASDAPGGKIRHILELAFNKMLDHGQYYEMVESMWEREWGEYNLNLLQNSKMLNQ